MVAGACCSAAGMATGQCCSAAHARQRSHAPLLPVACRTALSLRHATASPRHRTRLGSGSRSRRAVTISASALAVSHLAPLAVAGLGIESLGSLTSALGFALAALFAARAWGQVEQPDSHLPECPRCEGTGFTDCLCTRWSDGDTGCSACRGSGRMPCPNCGGGGRATPLRQELTVRADD